MASKTGTCRLCERENIKFAKSHIIPKSLWGTTLNSESGPARIVSAASDVMPKRSPMGEYDQSILCIDCEERFSPWDDYAHELLVKTVPVPVFFDGDEPLAAQFEDFDMFKLRMFFISLLWRMHVTKRPMFNSVDVGPYFEKLTFALSAQNPEFIQELDVVVSRFDDELSDAIISPSKSKLGGVNVYWIHFARHSCRVKLDKRPFPEPFNSLAISNGSPFHILKRDFSDSPELQIMKEIEMGRQK